MFLNILIGLIKIQKGLKKELEVSDQQKNFMLSVTHELKTPLASSKLYLDTLLKRDLDIEKQKDIYKKIQLDNNRLIKLVEHILLATNLEHENMAIMKETTDISRLCEETIKSVSGTRGKDHITETSITPGIQLKVDELLFSSILLNIYDNAVKYSEPGSLIEVVLNKDKEYISLSVKDQGKGISQEESKKIFQRFYRSENEEIRKTKGTGLGLYIVNQLVKAHNGVIEISSNQPKGSIFTVKFKINDKQK